MTPGAQRSAVDMVEHVAVVVVMYNSADVIGGFIDALPAGMSGVDFELIAVDNASSDESATLVEQTAPWAHVVRTGRNGGYAAGINAGVAAATGATAYLVVNPDVRLHAGCIEQLLRTLRSPGCGIAVPKLLDAKGALIESQRREPTVLRAFADALVGARRAGRSPRLGEVVTDHRCYESPTAVDWAEGSTVLFSAESWERCGPWDESFFLYSEETDFALRVGDAGLEVRYDPAATATHLEGGSATNPRLWGLLACNRVRLYRKRHALPAAATFWSAVVLREAIRAATGQATGRAALRALLSPTRMRETPGPHSIAARRSV